MLVYCHMCGKYIDGCSLDSVTPDMIDFGMCEACADAEAQAHYQEILLKEGTHESEVYPND